MYRWRLIWARIGGPVVGTAIALLLVGAAIGGYLYASSKGVESATAVRAAKHDGAMRGEARGKREGFDDAFKTARDRAYNQAYADSYLAAYRNQFEQAGLAVPDQVVVKSP